MMNRDYHDYHDCRDFVFNQANPINHENHGSNLYRERGKIKRYDKLIAYRLKLAATGEEFMWQVQ